METILIAGDPSSHDFVMRAYGDLAEVKFAASVKEAETLIAAKPPTILIGTLAFDDSKFLHVLDRALEQKIKVVIVDCPATILDDAVIQVVKSYATEMGVMAWWDMRHTVEESGLEVAAGEIRAIVQNLLNDSLPNTAEVTES